ncbi:hypothetical protein THICB3320726 [Thiomonas sp. CB3]|nr:hypothetical protein THICB3320726 [Thiomonas sp. CB3]
MAPHPALIQLLVELLRQLVKLGPDAVAELQKRSLYIALRPKNGKTRHSANDTRWHDSESNGS